jgi:hypothetical protein
LAIANVQTALLDGSVHVSKTKNPLKVPAVIDTVDKLFALLISDSIILILAQEDSIREITAFS